ncbi:MAG: hypothetical protein E7428_00935 [Ruminococcaceae bacterium]|nr:hypothetical protein [Oscillospiraceae bacterium]
MVKRYELRFLSGILLLSLIVSVLAACAESRQQANDATDTYLGEVIDIGLAENEMIMNVAEIGGEIRFTIGVECDEINALYGTDKGIPYKTEYRYYDMEFIEDTAKRETTTSFQEVGRADNLVFGGEPFEEDGSYNSVQYRFYLDGQPTGHAIIPEDQLTDSPATRYNARVNLMEKDGIIYAGICGINYFADNAWSLYIGDHFVKKTTQKPGVEVDFFGLMEIGGTPYALIREREAIAGAYRYFNSTKEAACLIPLTFNTIDLSGEGIEIEGRPTGGAFSDGTYGYYMCGSELWRTNGVDCKKLADLIYCGVDETSVVRKVCTLADGRILVVANGGMIELTASESIVPAERSVYTLGVVNYYNYSGLLSKTVAKFNGQSDGVRFVVKEYSDITKMNLALLSGEVDMIVSSDHFMLKNYVKQGLLAPLEEVAPALFEEGVLIENIVDVTRMEGICYFLPREFLIEGKSVRSTILEEGQTFDHPKDFFDLVLETSPTSMKFNSKDFHMEHYGTNIDDWIDWDNNTCHFDDGSFETLLEFCNLGAGPGETRSHGSDVMPFGLQNLINQNEFVDWETANEYSGDSAWVVVPIPSTVHKGFGIDAFDYYAVVDRVESREAAREFLEWHFLADVLGEIPPDGPDGWSNEVLFESGYDYLSINRAECERVLSRNLIVEDEDNEEELVVEQRRYEDSWKIIQQADHLWYYSNAVFDVMMEEACRYFSGDITAKQAADYVQNRISLYLAEQG